jgi:hypothetical protein
MLGEMERCRQSMVINMGSANVAFLLQIKDSDKPCLTDFNAIWYNAIQ